MPSLTTPAGWRQPLDERGRFTFVLPPGWVRIRLTDQVSRQADIRSLAAHLTSGRPDRHRLAPQLVRHVEAATELPDPHAVEAHLSTTLNGGAPVAAALVVSLLPPGAGGLGPGAEVLPHDGGVVVRQERRGPGPSLLVQHLFPAEDGSAVLLSWSTPALHLTEPLTAAFDAVAGSLRRLA